MIRWTAEKLMGELAAIAVRLYHNETDDAYEMCRLIVPDDLFDLAEAEWKVERANDQAEQEAEWEDWKRKNN